jgi:YidC/Oxa1 family membrane protein insertase
MQNQNLNLIVAIVLSVGIMIGWQYFIERPKLSQNAQKHKEYNNTIAEIKKSQSAEIMLMPREQSLLQEKRIKFDNDLIYGSISTKGLRVDDLTFKKYKQTTDSDSPNVNLLSPHSSKESYFAETGWYSSSKYADLPNNNTIWDCDKDKIELSSVLTCKWTNSRGLIFTNEISLDDKYMFNMKSAIKNTGTSDVSVQPYGIIYKTYNYESNRMSIIHEGGSGVFAGELKEFPYKDIKDKKKIANNISSVDWLGITDKYWLVAFVPDKNYEYSSNSIYTIKNSLDRFQIDFISPSKIIEAGGVLEINHRLFGGAKELEILDFYEEKLNIKLFDRTVDFGWFYILTKPLLSLLHFIYQYVGNFGISIMIMTVLVKLAMFSLANKSYKSMKAMKELQPQIELLKQKCGDDKMRLNQEMMNLYKTRNVNPLSGCLPIFIQIPVFFSLYKVLNVSIDMRHADFFGWINDLSVADPTNLFNLFGFLPFTPPSFMHVGAWPLLMCVTMFLQQKMSPPISDPVQAQMMKLMPLVFLFMFSSFPAGLMIYWAWNNILSIAQQSYINYSNDK